jgi:hypothetical protein
VGYFVETSRKVLIVLPAIPLSALCHEYFLGCHYVGMLHFIAREMDSLVVTYPDGPSIYFVMNVF